MDPTLEPVLAALVASDPAGLALAVDGSLSGATLGAVALAFRALDALPPRPRSGVLRWCRRHRVRLRKAVPIAVPVLAALVRGGVAYASGGDPITGAVRGFGVALASIGLNELRAAPAKVMAATEAPDVGDGR